MFNREIERNPEITDAVRRFMELPRDKQETALVLVHGIAIGENISAMTAPPSAPSSQTV